MPTTEYVPAGRIAGIIGADATRVLLEHFGGGKLYIAAKPPTGSKLVQVIGGDAAWLLAEEFSTGVHRDTGAWIELPRGDQSNLSLIQAKMRDMIERDATDREIMDALGVVDRTVRRWRARLGKSRPTPAGPQDPRIEAMVRDGRRTPASIARELGIHVTTVRRWQKFYIGGGRSEQDKNYQRGAYGDPRVMAMLASPEATHAMIAERFSVSEETARSWRRRWRAGHVASAR